MEQIREQSAGSRPATKRKRILMVCTGNICRSPTAHGVLEKMVADAGLADRIEVDSAGTHDYHVGEAPDRRSQAHAARRGYDLSQQRARQLRAEDFTAFDQVLVMDGANESAARRICPESEWHRVQRLTDFCTEHSAREVPDPYYGGDRGFEDVLDLVEDACAGLLATLGMAPRKG
ncbi:protein tyrosine phosphatase [Delftia acidovorans SPH-1]|uniref:protein-tyrosine-phosphatase n=3 Tax=Comamonadaceae TaxID=80864 RepID=A9BT76_DELAS|nr:protein tyrosine phosphatase [Delftia acidovorans SPH-1]